MHDKFAFGLKWTCFIDGGVWRRGWAGEYLVTAENRPECATEGFRGGGDVTPKMSIVGIECRVVGQRLSQTSSCGDVGGTGEQ